MHLKVTVTYPILLIKDHGALVSSLSISVALLEGKNYSRELSTGEKKLAHFSFTDLIPLFTLPDLVKSKFQFPLQTWSQALFFAKD